MTLPPPPRSTLTHKAVSFLKETAKPKRASFTTAVKVTALEGHPLVAFDHQTPPITGTVEHNLKWGALS